MNAWQDLRFQKLIARGRVIASRPCIWELLLFTGVALYATWPLAGRLATAIPMGTERVATVPMFNLWTVWWNAESASRGFQPFWNAPIFFPADNSFAFSETQLTTIMTAPIVWLSSSPIPAYNIYLLGSLIANGWTACLLFKRVGLRYPSACLGGLMIELLPFVHWQLGVLQLVPLWGILWFILAIVQFAKQPRVMAGLNIGAALIVTYLLCHHYGLFLAVVTIPAVGWLWGRRLAERKTWISLIEGGLLTVLVLTPIAWKQTSVMRAYQWERNPALVQSLSAELPDYAVTPWPQTIPTHKLSPLLRRIYWKLSPGGITLLLAIGGLVFGIANREQRGWTAFCVTVLMTAAVLSFGSKFRIGPICLYDFLVDYCPGFAQVRNVFRFAVFVQIAAVCLAAGGLDSILNGQCRRFVRRCFSFCQRIIAQNPEKPDRKSKTGSDNRWARFIAVAVPSAVIGAGLFAVYDVQPPKQRLHELPSVEENADWIRWLTDQTDRDAVIACFPIRPGHTVFDYEETTQWMYWQTMHRRRMVNGYSGFFPPQHQAWKRSMRSFPDAHSIGEMQRFGVSYCVVRAASLNIPAEAEMQLVFRDPEANISIYQLRSARRLNSPDD